MANGVYVDGHPVEIERKFLVEIPDIELLKKQDNYNSSAIEQIYISGDGVCTGGRIRKREFSNGCKFYKTFKENISDVSRIEIETEITEDEYSALAKNILCETCAINKVRHCFDYKGQTFELDVYSFWDDKATLEIELESEEQPVDLPGFVRVIKEVTGDRSYTNYSLAKK